MYKYNAEKHCIVEQATMDMGKYGFADEQFVTDLVHANNPKSYPVQGEVKWLDGQEVEEGKDFELKPFVSGCECGEGNYFNPYSDNTDCWNCTKTYYNNKAAYPLQQAESEDELWQALLDELFYNKYYNYLPVLKSKFNITRKQ